MSQGRISRGSGARVASSAGLSSVCGLDVAFTGENYRGLRWTIAGTWAKRVSSNPVVTAVCA